MRLNSLVVQRVPIDSVRLPCLAVLQNPKKQIEKAQKLIARFGQIPAVLAEPNGEILFWEEVWLALKADGATHVDVMFVNHMSPAELKAIRLALHRTQLDAKFNDQNVRIVLEELASIDFDLDLTGFDPPEIDGYLNLDLPKANVEEIGEDIPPVESRAVSLPGSIWALEKHRLGCGDATDLAFARRVLDGRRAAVCFTDPPYNVKVSFISGNGRHRHREFVQGAGEMSRNEYLGFLCDSLSVVQACCSSTALIYTCIDWRHVMEMTVAGHVCGMPLYQIITWVKSNRRDGRHLSKPKRIHLRFPCRRRHPPGQCRTGKARKEQDQRLELPGHVGVWQGARQPAWATPHSETGRHDRRRPARRDQTWRCRFGFIFGIRFYFDGGR